ncbi:MAG: hypothetical protein RL687_291 [Candidatus Parcubacteria bacterium]|jgi:16S rRNA A1518/A1519 N6-dimethyltransferase RsmA/KsgA/DIM1 with predicted DNA glycosylase/AP lyase activity
MWAMSFVKTDTPFIRTPRSVLPYVFKALDLKDDSVVYDLGSGDSRLLYFLREKKNKATFIGLEKFIFPYILSLARKYLNKTKGVEDVKIIKKDFFDYNLSNATHLVMYLYPNVMDEMLKKFDEEIKEGTILVSVAFKFTNKQPVAEIDMERDGEYSNARKLYIYKF